MERRNFISQLGLAGLGVANINNIFSNIEEINEKGSIKEYMASNNIEEKNMIAIKIIKTKPGVCIATPTIEIPSSEGNWTTTQQFTKNGEYNGENIWEIYFNIQTNSPEFVSIPISISIPGVKASRVIIGHTDVPFEQTEDKVQFRIIDDKSMCQYMGYGRYQSPLGGYPIGFIHNWYIRRAGKYLYEDFPSAKFASIPNYLLAAQEVFRQMGIMGPGKPKSFNGGIYLLGSEVASSRGHMDYPPHVHIMLYEFEKGKEGNFNYMLSRLVPHFYMDDEGYIVHNHYVRMVGDKGTSSGEYGIGDVVSFVDAEGNDALDLIIEEKGGLTLKSYGGRSFSIRPDPEHGPTEAVIGYYNNKVICKAQTHDYPDLGIFRMRLEVYADGQSPKIINDGYLYDPFTANKYKELYEG